MQKSREIKGFPVVAALVAKSVARLGPASLQWYTDWELRYPKKTRCGSLGETAKPARPLTCRAAAHGFRLAG